MAVPVAPAGPVEVARAFAEAYAHGDVDGVARWLAPDVHEREITPAAIVDQRGRHAVVAELQGFLGPYEQPEILRHEVEPFGELIRWSTRWRLRGAHGVARIEWHAFLTVEGGLVSRLDVVCSGLVTDDESER